jgi:hypothetical protein
MLCDYAVAKPAVAVATIIVGIGQFLWLVTIRLAIDCLAVWLFADSEFRLTCHRKFVF